MKLTVKKLKELVKNVENKYNMYVKIIKNDKNEIYDIIESSPNPIKLSLRFEKDSKKVMSISDLLKAIDLYDDSSNIELIQTQSSIFITEIYDADDGELVDGDIFFIVNK